jgi:hypothetical protein
MKIFFKIKIELGRKYKNKKKIFERFLRGLFRKFFMKRLIWV